MSAAPPVAFAAMVPLFVGQSMPKNGTPRITFDAGTAAVYWASVVWLLNCPLVSGEAADGDAREVQLVVHDEECVDDLAPAPGML